MPIAHSELKDAIRDALLLRVSNEFVDPPAYRGFIVEQVGRRNARFTLRIEIERTILQDLPGKRTTDYEDAIVTVTSSSGLILVHDAIARGKRVGQRCPFVAAAANPDLSPSELPLPQRHFWDWAGYFECGRIFRMAQGFDLRPNTGKTLHMRREFRPATRSVTTRSVVASPSENRNTFRDATRGAAAS